MFEHVAVPHVSSGIALETDDNSGHHIGVDAHGIFPAGLGGLGRFGRTSITDLTRNLEPFAVKMPPVEDLEANQV